MPKKGDVKFTEEFEEFKLQGSRKAQWWGWVGHSVHSIPFFQVLCKFKDLSTNHALL